MSTNDPSEETATEQVARSLTEALIGEQRSLSAAGENLPPATDDPTPGGLWQAAPASSEPSGAATNDQAPSDPGTSQPAE